MLQGQHLIGGKWRGSGDAFITRSPSNLEEAVGQYPLGTAEDAFAAVDVARQALPAWEKFNTQGRCDILRRVGEALTGRAREIGTLLAREEGKTLREAVGETQRAAQAFFYYAGEVVRHPGQFYNSLRDGHQVIVSYEPVGVVSLITPWNFPIAIPAWKVAGALAYGNTCVLKPSEFAPGCAVMLGRILEESGLPAGVFNLVHGDGRVLGDTLVAQADAVSFTGSTRTGRAILQTAAVHMTKERPTPGHYLAPTLFVNTTPHMQLNREETFGPIAGVIQVADLEEAIAVATDCELALSAGICTTNIRSAERFRRASPSGTVMINAPTAGIDYHVPFGGRVPSGYGGRELGPASAEFFTEIKTAYVNHGSL